MEMDALNLRVLVNLSGGSGDGLKQLVQTIRTSKYTDRFRVFANVNWNGAGGPDGRRRRGPRWSKRSRMAPSASRSPRISG